VVHFRKEETLIDSFLLITAANWISSEDEKKSPISSALLEACRSSHKYAIIGLGCQSGLNSSPSEFTKSINPIVKERLIKFIAGACAIAVRDAFTQEVISDIIPGINSTVLGCISNFTSSAPDLEEILRNNLGKLSEALKKNKEISGLLAVTEHTINPLSISETRKTLRCTLELFRRYPSATYVLQSKYMMPVAYKYKNEHHDLLEKYLSKEGLESLSKISVHQGIYFCDIPSWLEFYSEKALCIGWRIHGSVLALQSGCPSIVFAHDERVKGLAETMKVPSISAEKALKIIDPSKTTNQLSAELTELLEEQIEIYLKKRAKLHRDWKTFFQSLEISLSDKFANLYSAS
jgi:hypothetical protein